MSRPLTTNELTFPDQFRNSLKIRRMASQPSVLLLAVPTALFAAPEPGALIALNTIVGIILVLLAYQFAFITNCVSDQDQDAYGHKSDLSNAVRELGKRNVNIQLGATIVAIGALGGYLMFATGHWDLFPIGLLALVIGAQYSYPPLRLKGRGLLQVPALIITMGMMPAYVIVRSFDTSVDWLALLAALSSTIVIQGLGIVKTAEDIPEDEQSGTMTFVRAAGMRRSLWLAVSWVCIGGAGVLWVCYSKSGFSMAQVPYVLAVFYVTWTLLRLISETRGLSIEQAAGIFRSRPLFWPMNCSILGITLTIAAADCLLNR